MTRRRLVVLAVLGAVVLAAWLARRPLLVGAARVLVAEDPLAPVDVVVVSMTNGRASALEAAALHEAGTAPRVALLTWRTAALDAELVRRGVAPPDPTGLARQILERSGVPREAIAVVPGPVDGTNAEVAAIAAWARRERPASLLYVTARSHTARARRRLRDLLPEVAVRVRSSRWDGFPVDGWWRRRGASREVMSEYLRWANTFVFGDRWRPAAGTP
jgi:uncharacterized SAM-binding protein YcdF (DUF218 family)